MNRETDLTILIYSFFFGMFVIMLSLLIYAPLYLSIVAGLAISFLGAIILNKQIKTKLQKINIFDVAQKTGKIIAQVFVPPNKVYMFLADKDIGEDAVKIKIYRKGKYETYKFNLSPNQQFQLEIPEQEVGNQAKSKEIYVWDLINDPRVVFQLTEPTKQIFKVEPYNVEMVMFVYPTEILTREQLQLLNLVEKGEVKQKVKMQDEVTGKIIEKDITIPVYSPKPYALSSDNIQEISAKHRFSTIATILEQTKAILSGAETLATTKVIGGFGFNLQGLLKNKTFWIILILVAGLIFFFMINNMILGGLHQTMNPLAEQALKKLAERTTTGKTFP